jgi:chemotaxis protein methyltransferase CheR
MPTPDLPRAAIDVTDEEVHRLCDFLYRKTGISFDEKKRYYIDRRLAARIAATESGSFNAYFAGLRANADHEVEHFINSFTVNETYFYREDAQLRCLSSTLLDQVAAKRPKNAPIKIWSVPCSTGEEPYSIALWLLENWAKVDLYDIEIIGSDIDTSVLRAAEAAIYGERALMRLSKSFISRYFERLEDGLYRLVPALSRTIQFTRCNIVDSAQTRRHSGFDVIFCRNVLMYFDDASRRIAAENLYDCLTPGGFICLGHTESMSRISSLFEVCRFAVAIVYQRPGANSHE